MECDISKQTIAVSSDDVEATNLGPSHSDNDDNKGKFYDVIHSDSIVHKLIWSEKCTQDPYKA